MASTGLARVEGENERLKARLRTQSRTHNQRAKSLQSLAVKAGAAFAIGKWDLASLAEISGVDGLAVIAGLGMLAGEFVDGDAGEVLRDVGESAAILYAHKLGDESGSDTESEPTPGP